MVETVLNASLSIVDYLDSQGCFSIRCIDGIFVILTLSAKILVMIMGSFGAGGMTPRAMLNGGSARHDWSRTGQDWIRSSKTEIAQY